MNPNHLLNQTVTIVTVTDDVTLDVYGNADTTETMVTTVGYLEQQQRGESGDENQILREGWTLFLPAGTVVGGDDRVIVDGNSYEVDGPSWAVFNPRTRTYSHVRVWLKDAG